MDCAETGTEQDVGKQAALNPPFAKCAKDGAPSVLQWGKGTKIGAWATRHQDAADTAWDNAEYCSELLESY